MISFKNYSAKGGINNATIPTGKLSLLLTGAGNGTIVKSLEIMTGNESSYVEIIRTTKIDQDTPDDAQITAAAYATIRVDMKANDYLVLWEGFFVIPKDNRIYIRSDSQLCTVVANVVEMS